MYILHSFRGVLPGAVADEGAWGQVLSADVVPKKFPVQAAVVPGQSGYLVQKSTSRF